MEVQEIVEAYLKENGFDGLRSTYGGCGCEIGDLVPCDLNFAQCEPGYRTDCDCGEGCSFHMIAIRPTPTIAEALKRRTETLANLARYVSRPTPAPADELGRP